MPLMWLLREGYTWYGASVFPGYASWHSYNTLVWFESEGFDGQTCKK